MHRRDASGGGEGSGIQTADDLEAVLSSRDAIWACNKLDVFFQELRFRKDYFSPIFYPAFDSILATLFGYYEKRK